VVVFLTRKGGGNGGGSGNGRGGGNGGGNGNGGGPAGRLRRRWAAHAVALTALALTVGGGVLAVVNRRAGVLGPDGELAGGSREWSQIVLAVAFTAAGWLLAAKRPEVVFGWLALAAAVGHGASAAGTGWGVFALSDGRHLPGVAPALSAALAGEPLENVVLVTTWAAFPSGHFPRGRIRWAAVASVALCAAGWLYGQMTPITFNGAPSAYSRLTNPLAIDALPTWVPIPLFVSGLVLGSAVMVVRWLQAAGELRRVLRWLAVVNVVAILVTPVVVAFPAGQMITTVAMVIILVVITAVVLKNQVYGIDVVLNRTLVYTLLTAFVAGVYAAGVALLAALGQAVGGPWTVVAALGAAFSLAPARSRVQRLVNRFLYGERDEPYTVIGRIGSRLEAAGSTRQLLPGLLEAVVGALRLPSAAVEMRGDDGAVRRIDHGGEPPQDASVRFPLVHQGRDVGALVVGLRAGQNTLDLRETRLLEDIARQVAAAVSNVMLTEALVRSRERVVAAAEEERLRLRRDLHDGLGPVLTAAATKVDAACNLTGRDLPRARDLLGRVRHDLTAALADLRRLVYALRPPVLDELGLLGALREQLHHAALPVALAAPDPLPPLPAAVEIAAYRIVTEAVTNVTRHAGATRCAVSIACDDRLTIEIRDDGATGDTTDGATDGAGEGATDGATEGATDGATEGADGPTWPPGVGLTSMRERATALGGTWSAGPTPAGGRVHVELPLSLAGSPAGSPAGNAAAAGGAAPMSAIAGSAG
jgi:signal transduction histidine kinase